MVRKSCLRSCLSLTPAFLNIYISYRFAGGYLVISICTPCHRKWLQFIISQLLPQWGGLKRKMQILLSKKSVLPLTQACWIHERKMNERVLEKENTLDVVCDYKTILRLWAKKKKRKNPSNIDSITYTILLGYNKSWRRVLEVILLQRVKYAHPPLVYIKFTSCWRVNTETRLSKTIVQ